MVVARKRPTYAQVGQVKLQRTFQSEARDKPITDEWIKDDLNIMFENPNPVVRMIGTKMKNGYFCNEHHKWEREE